MNAMTVQYAGMDSTAVIFLDHITVWISMSVPTPQPVPMASTVLIWKAVITALISTSAP